MRKSRKLSPITGDEAIDAFAEMRNSHLRKQRTKAPIQMNAVEEQVLLHIIPAHSIARIVCNNKAAAEYAKVRIRKFLMELGWNEMIATSVQQHELIIWQIAAYEQWRIVGDPSLNKMWIDARADNVTVVQESSRAFRNYDEDKKVINKVAKQRAAQTTGWGIMNLEVAKAVVVENLKNGYIDQAEHDKIMNEIKEEEERRKELD